MSTMVVVTVVLTLPCVLLVKPPSDEHDRRWVSIVSGVKAPPKSTLAGLVKKISHPVNKHFMHNLEVDDTQTVHPTDIGPNHSQIYNFDKSSTHPTSLESKKNFSANLQDFIHDVNDKGLEEIESPNKGNEWTSLFKPEQLLISNLTSSEIITNAGGLSRSSFEIDVLNHPTKYNEDRLDHLTRQASRFPGLNTYFAPSVGIYYGTGPLQFPNGEMSVLVSSSDTNPPVPSPNPPVPSPNPPVPSPNPPVPRPNPPVTNTNPQVIIFPESPTNPQVPIIKNPESSNIINTQIPTPSSEQYSIESNNLNWPRVGLLLAFIKLGLVKLKSVGFIKILLFFLIKFKLVLILVFFKTISILNMLLFSKFVVIPLFILPLLPIIVSIISPTLISELFLIPEKITKYIMILGPAYFRKFSTSTTKTNSSTIDA